MVPSRDSINSVRARKDRDYAAMCLLSTATAKAQFVKNIPSAYRDEAAADVTQALLREWDKGVDLKELLSWVSHRLRLSGVAYYRKQVNRPELTLDAPVKGGEDTLNVDLIASKNSSVEETVLAHERIAGLGPQLERLERYMATRADERLKIIYSLSLQGMPRKEIAAELTAAGIPTSADNVHQIIKRRLRDPFPELGFLFDQHTC